MLVKLGGLMVARVDKMWANVLKNKYVKSEAILNEAKAMDSPMWKGIMKSLHHVAGGFG